MLFHYHRRLLLTLCRQTISLSNHIQLSKNIQIRHINFNDQTKRKILLRINTVLNDNGNLDENKTESDIANIACLNNELILSERMVKFPFHYRCVLEQQLSVCQDRWVSNDEWKELYNIVGEITKPLFASITMLVCVQLKHIERGRSLFQFIQQYHPDLLLSTTTTYSAYMNLLALDFFTRSGKKHGQDYSSYEKELCEVYQKFVKDRKQPIIASVAALGIIKGLCVTRLWHEAYSYLPFVNDDDQLPAIRDLILAALHNNDIHAAIKLVKNLKCPPPSDGAAATMSSSLTDIVRDIFRNLDEKNVNADELIEELFHYLSTLDYFIEKSAVDEMQAFFAKFQPNTFDYGTTFVYPSGACKQLSGLNLSSGELSDDEFDLLRNYLMKSAYTAKEVFNTTTPAEFEKFKILLARNKFTMIVDGLNILYGIDRFATDPVKSMVKTINFLKNLRVSRTQMLFIARKHALSRISSDIQKDLRSICEVFLVDNTSRDDWFVLYAALHSKAYVLTSDILRKERGIANKHTPAKNVQINEKLQKWLYRYQYMFIRQGNRVYFKQPMAYKLRAQYTQNVWLIPYFNQKPLSLAQRPDDWFFVYKISDNKQIAVSALKRKRMQQSMITEEKKKSYAFESDSLSSSPHSLILIGGLTDGLLSLTYVEKLSSKLESLSKSCSLFRSSNLQYGWHTIDDDVRDLKHLIIYLIKNRTHLQSLILLGHPTACQDIIHYLRQDKIHHVILQGPARDREYLSRLSSTKDQLDYCYKNNKDPKEWLPRYLHDLPLTIERCLSLNEINPIEDLFSSDLTDEQLKNIYEDIETPIAWIWSKEDVENFVKNKND